MAAGELAQLRLSLRRDEEVVAAMEVNRSGEAVKALEAAMAAAKSRGVLEKRGTNAIARDAVAAYLDSLAGDIPEEAVKAAASAYFKASNGDVPRAGEMEATLKAALLSLRSSLDGS